VSSPKPSASTPSPTQHPPIDVPITASSSLSVEPVNLLLVKELLEARGSGLLVVLVRMESGELSDVRTKVAFVEFEESRGLRWDGDDQRRVGIGSVVEVQRKGV
jgi:hypothetical protein